VAFAADSDRFVVAKLLEWGFLVRTLVAKAFAARTAVVHSVKEKTEFSETAFTVESQVGRDPDRRPGLIQPQVSQSLVAVNQSQQFVRERPVQLEHLF
jgi:hypothetical protein